jgi:hypothetical protein
MNKRARLLRSKQTTLFIEFAFSKFFYLDHTKRSQIFDFLIRINCHHTSCLYFFHQTNKSLNHWRILLIKLTSMSFRKIMLWCFFVLKISSSKWREKLKLYAIEMIDWKMQEKKNDVISLIDASNVSFLLRKTYERQRWQFLIVESDKWSTQS